MDFTKTNLDNNAHRWKQRVAVTGTCNQIVEFKKSTT
ncbi:hypothetical protein A2U01_0026768, partial [Trifolium medium]|nr:hypothetical protein [Trifolium medium]